MEKFAEYILEEENLVTKYEIMYYLKKRINIFFDNSVILKTKIAQMFIDEMKLDVDRNVVLTACLLYACKKSDNPQALDKIKAYPYESAEFLSNLGFTEDFCAICEQHSRFIERNPRKKESDILELVDQFGGMLLHREERKGFSVEDALCLLEYRNLKNKTNQYLETFKEFVRKMEEVRI